MQAFRHAPVEAAVFIFLDTAQPSVMNICIQLLKYCRGRKTSAVGIWDLGKEQRWPFPLSRSCFPVMAVGCWEINLETVQDKDRGGAQTGQRLHWSLKIIICCVTGNPFLPFIYVKKPSLTGTVCVWRHWHGLLLMKRGISHQDLWINPFWVWKYKRSILGGTRSQVL